MKLRRGQKLGPMTLIEPTKVEYKHKTYAGWVIEYWWGERRVMRSDYLKAGFGKRKRPVKITSMMALMRQYKGAAKRRRLAWKLGVDFFKNITSSNCHYCGIAPKQKAWYKNAVDTYVYNGIDRINNKIGYYKDNVLPCCKRCNHAKANMQYHEFLDLIERIHSNVCTS